MGRIPQEIIDQILDRLDIVEVISGYIPLKRAGRSFKACCPFHNEKTPSFVVSPEKQIYHCFGCSAGGNAMNFVMKYENMEFPEVVRYLAEKVGVEVPRNTYQDAEKVSLSSKLYKINEIASKFYQKHLLSEHGRGPLEYLLKRGITKETISEFGIGYAPNSWEAFRKFCELKKIPADIARKAGLTIPSEKGKGDYDRFRNRITYPISNERGSVVAFGARVMDNSLPKYINSPETPVYNKSNILYGLNISRKGIREKGYAVIVEGYMDVIVPHQYGVTNLVATSGTALTPNQVKMLKKYSDTAVMLFDSDQAGEAASLRGLDVMIEGGMDVRIAALPEGDDPDSFVRAKGKEAFEAALDDAKGLFDYKLDLLIKRSGKRNIGVIVNEMLPTIRKVPNAVVQSDYLRRLAEKLSVHEASLRYEMGKVKSDYTYKYGESRDKDPSSEREHNKTEMHLLGLAISGKKLFSKLTDEITADMFTDPVIRELIRDISELYGKGEKDKNIAGKLLMMHETNDAARAAIVKAIAYSDIIVEEEKSLSDCISSLKRESRAARLKDLMNRLKKAQNENNSSEMKELLAKINKIHKEKVA